MLVPRLEARARKGGMAMAVAHIHGNAESREEKANIQDWISWYTRMTTPGATAGLTSDIQDQVNLKLAPAPANIAFSLPCFLLWQQTSKPSVHAISSFLCANQPEQLLGLDEDRQSCSKCFCMLLIC